MVIGCVSYCRTTPQSDIPRSPAIVWALQAFQVSHPMRGSKLLQDQFDLAGEYDVADSSGTFLGSPYKGIPHVNQLRLGKRSFSR